MVCSNYDDDFASRLVLVGYQELGWVLHNPTSNEIRPDPTSFVNLNALVGRPIVMRYG